MLQILMLAFVLVTSRAVDTNVQRMSDNAELDLNPGDIIRPATKFILRNHSR